MSPLGDGGDARGLFKKKGNSGLKKTRGFELVDMGKANKLIKLYEIVD